MILHIFSPERAINEKDHLKYSLVAVKMATLLPLLCHYHSPASHGEKAVTSPKRTLGFNQPVNQALVGGGVCGRVTFTDSCPPREG